MPSVSVVAKVTRARDTINDRANLNDGGDMVAISITETDASVLREVFDAKLVDLRREISHTDSPRFRDTLYQVEGALQRMLAQLPAETTTRT
jgi:hypothetical protein